VTASAAFLLAVRAYQAGDFAGAERSCRIALTEKPNDFDTLHFLGVILARNGHSEEAVRLLESAMELNPGSAAVQVNLGNALIQVGRIDQALQAFDTAARLAPGDVAVQLTRARILWNTGQLETAEKEFRQIAASGQAGTSALSGLAGVLLELQHYEEALEIGRRLCASAQNQPTFHYTMALALYGLHRHHDVIAALDRTLTLAPIFIDAYGLRGLVLIALGRSNMAAADFEKVRALGGINIAQIGELIAARRFQKAQTLIDVALAENPHNAVALNCRSVVLKELGDFETALQCLDQAVASKPDFPEAHYNRGILLHLLGRYEPALRAFDQAIAHNPTYAEAYYNRSVVLRVLERFMDAYADCEKALALAPRHAQAAFTHFFLAAQFCIWSNYHTAAETLRRIAVENKKTDPFVLLCTDDDPALHLRAARTSAHPTKKPAEPRILHKHARRRIAYLSADFIDHPVAYQAAELFEHHNRDSFETYGFCTHPAPSPSPIRERLEKSFDHFLSVGKWSDANIAKLLATNEIDIAVELGGYTSRARPAILSWRPAPIAVTYLGYPGTLGTDYIDYIIADTKVLPSGRDEDYTEKIVRLPDCFMPSSAPSNTQSPPTRREAGLPESGFVFCSFANGFKLTPEIFAIWMRLLKETDNSVLWLSVGGQVAQDNLRIEATTLGISPARLIFAPRLQDREQHLARLSLADIYLDTFPYGAHATASDFLRAGVPIVTLQGKSFASRVAASMLTAAGLPELITGSIEDYEAKILELAQHPETLSAIRSKTLRARHSALFDMEKLCRNLEIAYHTMWNGRVCGHPPESFIVGETI
jgi:protein O-GlcNAc transferase